MLNETFYLIFKHRAKRDILVVIQIFGCKGENAKKKAVYSRLAVYFSASELLEGIKAQQQRVVEKLLSFHPFLNPFWLGLPE